MERLPLQPFITGVPVETLGIPKTRVIQSFNVAGSKSSSGTDSLFTLPARKRMRIYSINYSIDATSISAGDFYNRFVLFSSDEQDNAFNENYISVNDGQTIFLFKDELIIENRFSAAAPLIRFQKETGGAAGVVTYNLSFEYEMEDI